MNGDAEITEAEAKDVLYNLDSIRGKVAQRFAQDKFNMTIKIQKYLKTALTADGNATVIMINSTLENPTIFQLLTTF